MTGREQEVAALRAVFHDNAEACCLVNAVRDEAGRVVDFEVVEINRACERALRRRRDEVVGKRIAAVFFDAGAAETARRVMASGEQTTEEVEGVLRRMSPAGDGVAVTLHAAGDPGRAAVEFERVLGGLTHDINNLLTPILAYANIGLSQIGPGDPMHEELLEIRRAAERATLLISQVNPAPKCTSNADG
jgi:signal transduction histidine kinase